ncbi:MAG: sigma-70 family RNA polymerase sigma factor [Muribaculaceae bacterium]|nr:sigma-70 family RNA polymerase sigma factor [Muribaculaceae bacterium]
MTATEFKTIILPLYGPMRVMAVRMLGYEEGQDAAQDVIKKLWESHSDISVKDNVKAYVMRTVKNRCIDLLRSTGSTVPLEDKGNFEAPDDGFIELERLSRLDAALDSLDERKRDIMKLSLSGMKGDDIASRLSLTPSNVRQLLSRARQDLKRLLTNRN